MRLKSSSRRHITGPSGGSGTPPLSYFFCSIARRLRTWQKSLIAPPPPPLSVPQHGCGSKSRQHIRLWRHSKGLGPILFYIILCSGNNTTHASRHTYTPHTPQPTPTPLPVTPTPTLPTWKSQKSDSMSRQRRVLALSASTTLPGHRVTFLQLPRQRRTRLRPPYAAPPMPSTQRHRECQNTQVGKHHLHRSRSLGPPSLWGGMERTEGASTPPLTSRICK